MAPDPSDPTGAELRRIAEARLAAEPGDGEAAWATAAHALARLVHELQVHHVELELQNDELRRSRDEIERAQRRYTELHALAPIGLVTVDAGGQIRELNLAGAELLRGDRAALVGRRFDAALAPPLRGAWARFVAGVVDARGPGHAEIEVILGDEGAPAVRVVGAPVEGPSGERCCLCALSDISADRAAASTLRRAKEIAEGASRAKSAFLAMVSHELRTPMSNIYLSTKLALAEELSPRARHLVDLVAQSTESLLKIIADTLDLAKIEAGRFELEVAEFDLPALVLATLDPLRPSADLKSIAITVEIDPRASIRVHGDPTRLRQVLVNLVGNAIKFTPRGAIAVRVAPDDEPAATEGRLRVLFTVEDTGIGVLPEESAIIFERYIQASRSRAISLGGAGLGLAIARDLVALMHGRIWVEPRPGGGSIFRFSIEVAPSPTPAAEGVTSEAPVEAEAAAMKRVLIADDDPLCRELIGDLVRSAGHQVVTVSDGVEVLEALAEDRFDLLLLDLQMPRMGGIEATQEIRRGAAPSPAKDLVIVGLTARGDPRDHARCLEAGMNECLQKPLSLTRLAQALAVAAQRPAR